MQNGPLPNTATLNMSRLERKFILPGDSSGFAAAWLRHHLIADPEHPFGLVNSLYLDCEELAAYHECLNGDIYKNKVRIRWYDTPEPDGHTTAYLEVKSKAGFHTEKRRKQVSIPGALLRQCKAEEIIAGIDVGRDLAELGYSPAGRLRPVVFITYSRNRFRERQSGISVSYDWAITARIAGNDIVTLARQARLRTAVMEIKGGNMTLPPVFSSLGSANPIWSNFSKYAKCLESLLERPGCSEWLRD